MRPSLQLIIVYFNYIHSWWGEAGWRRDWTGEGSCSGPLPGSLPREQNWLTALAPCPLMMTEVPKHSLRVTRVLRPAHSCKKHWFEGSLPLLKTFLESCHSLSHISTTLSSLAFPNFRLKALLLAQPLPHLLLHTGICPHPSKCIWVPASQTPQWHQKWRGHCPMLLTGLSVSTTLLGTTHNGINGMPSLKTMLCGHEPSGLGRTLMGKSLRYTLNWLKWETTLTAWHSF